MSERKENRNIENNSREFANLFARLDERLTKFYGHEQEFVNLKLEMNSITEEFKTNLYNKAEIISSKINTTELKLIEVKDVFDIYKKAWSSSDMPERKLTKEDFIKIQQDANTTFLVAHHNSKVVGFVLLLIERKDRFKIGSIAGLGVSPEYQQKGVGTYLGIKSYEFFKERDVDELHCKVYKKNKVAYKFIKSLGFEEYTEDTTGLLSLK